MGWIGPKDLLTLKHIAHEELKWIDFHEARIEIFGIYFSHNKNYSYKNNHERTLENFKTTLSIWRARPLTPIGKIQIVKSLGLSKLYYVCSNLGASEAFIKLVKSEVVNFVWNGKKTKNKYKTVIGCYNDGGLKLPDFGSIIKGSLFKWVTRLMNHTYQYWKVLPLRKLKNIGGIDCI